MNLSEHRGNLRFLDGLRGILCLIVVVDHCVNTFMPSLRFTRDPGFHGFLKHIFALSPLNIIYSGLPSVYLFFIMSGFVISYKYNKTRESNIIIKSTLKRYLRFSIPIIASYFIMYLSSLLFWDQPLSIKKILWESIYGSEFTHERMTNYALWTISFEIFGSFLIFSLLGIFGSSKNRILFYSLVMIFLFNTNYSFFVFGLILSDLWANEKINHINSKYLLSILIFLSALFITYPYPRNGVHVGGIYNIITFSKDWSCNYSIYTKIGSFLFFVTILSSNSLKKLFGSNIPLFFGKISFPIYLIHPSILISFAFVFGSSSNFKNFLCMLFLSIATTIIFSIPFEIFIDRSGIKISNKFSKFFFENKIHIIN